MTTIVPVDSDVTRILAQGMFREYCQFLRDTRSCGTNYHAFDEEIAALPAPYCERNGEVLLALVNGDAAACIAYRRCADDVTTCEIKRLYVRPGVRGLGLARKMIAEALDRGAARGYVRAILDTDVTTMPAAHALYLSIDFREYAPRKGALAYLEISLPRAAALTEPAAVDDAR